MQFLSFFIEEEIYIFPKKTLKTESEPLSNTSKVIVNENVEKNIEVKDVPLKTVVKKETSTGFPTNNLSILIYEERDTSIILKEKLFLNNILNYFKLDPSLVKIINLHSEKNENSLLNVLENLNLNKVIAFGLNDKFLQDSIKFYQINKHNDIVFTVCPSLTEIAQSRQEKLNLWNVLKLFLKSETSNNE